MKTGDVASFLLQHLVAAVVSFVIFVVGSVLLVVLGMIIGNDLGGPMFFPIFVLFALFGAACACVGLFAVAALLQVVRRWLHFSWWVPVVLVFPLTFAVLTLLGTAGSSRPGRWLLAASGIVSIAFWAYWGTLYAAGGILRFIRAKWTRAHRDSPPPSPACPTSFWMHLTNPRID
ncbi:MAG: hypothetical protein WCI20_07995, partial [bacterium]